MSKYLDDIKSIEDTLYSAAKELLGLAESFAHVGNDQMYHRLHGMATDVSRSRRTLTNTVTNNINDHVAESQQASINMLDGVLAGLKIGKGITDENIS